MFKSGKFDWQMQPLPLGQASVAPSFTCNFKAPELVFPALIKWFKLLENTLPVASAVSGVMDTSEPGISASSRSINLNTHEAVESEAIADLVLMTNLVSRKERFTKTAAST
tara:strand:- start:394 stop:726 length:333 start_codon:yes stop_codon:yes gene_type:complete